jgi:hypothetical protein
VGSEEPVEEGFKHGDIAHFGRDVGDHDRVVVRPWQGEPFETEGDIGAVFEPEQSNGEGGKEPSGSNVGAIDMCVPDAVPRGQVGHGGEGELGVVCCGVAIFNIER